MFANNIKIFLKMKNKDQFSITKIITKYLKYGKSNRFTNKDWLKN